jgi:hypothetical protein
MIYHFLYSGGRASRWPWPHLSIIKLDRLTLPSRGSNTQGSCSLWSSGCFTIHSSSLPLTWERLTDWDWLVSGNGALLWRKWSCSWRYFFTKQVSCWTLDIFLHICTFLGRRTLFGAAKGQVCCCRCRRHWGRFWPRLRPLLDQSKVQVDSQGHLAFALYLEIELPFEFAQIYLMSSSSKCRIDFDIELQLVFIVIHRFVSRTRCQSQSRDENATLIGQDQGVVLLGSYPRTLVESLEIDHEIDLMVNLVTLRSN